MLKNKKEWNTWPTTHHGPVIDYIAKVSGTFNATTPGALNFVKIDQSGLINDASPPGTWATDNLISKSRRASYSNSTAVSAEGRHDHRAQSRLSTGSILQSCRSDSSSSFFLHTAPSRVSQRRL